MGLTVRLIGNPEITIDQQPLSFRTRKELALFIYLLVEGNMHSRESLMGMFWPDSPAKNAAVTLRGSLSRLRHSLQPAGQIILSLGRNIGINKEGAIDTDVNWLAAAVLPDTPLEALKDILTIDRGEFLAGFSLDDAPAFDTWATIQREACQRQVEIVYDRLTQYQLANHELISAMKTAARWIARASLSEAAYRRLMAAQALGGDRAGALGTYAQCQAMLADEFGIEPARETAILAENIGQERLVRKSGGRLTAQKIPFTMLAPPDRPGLPLPFEGRADEHRQLVAAFQQVSQGGSQIVALIGAAGVGKTRLLGAFREWVVLNSPGVEIWNGRAFEMGGRLPYQPVIDALRLRLEQENAPEDLLDDIWLAELSQLMPELRARYPDLPPPMSGDASFARARLFSAVANLGSALAARSPAVFILDDMQWADAETLEMVYYLSQRWAESRAPILLLLSVRQENFAATAALREWLAQLGRDMPVIRLLIDGLSGAAVRQLVTRLASPDADPMETHAFGDWLWAETHGLPFFIEALLQMLIAKGVLEITDAEGGSGYDFRVALAKVKSGGQIQVPQGVRDAILSRLDQLSENEADILLAATVLGRECSFERLFQVAGISELQSLEAVESLLNRRLLAENRTARQPYTLYHDYIREVIYGESHEARRRVFHRRALISLEADQAPAAECAFHALASMLDEPAFRYSLIAGDNALRANASQESLVHYERARQIAQKTVNETAKLATSSLKRLYQNRGRALELTLQYEVAQANYQELANLAVKRDDPALKLAATLAQCTICATYTPVYDPQKARELGTAALELAVKIKDREAEAKALWCLMLVEFHTGDGNRNALAYGESALVLARELGLIELEGYVLGNLSWAYSLSMRLDEARQANRKALDIWLALGNLPMAADAYAIKMGNQRLAGDLEDLLATGSETVRLSQEIGNALHQYMALLLMSESHCMQGRLGQALIYIEQAAAISKESGDDRLRWGHHLYQMPTYIFGGALEQAEQLADQLFAIQENSQPIFQPYLLAMIAWTKIAIGKLQDGEAVLKEAFPTPDQEVPFSFTIVPLIVAEGHLQLALGNPRGALYRMEAIVDQLKLAGGRYYLAELYWLLGKAWLALENTSQAKQVLLEAAEVAEATSERTILWHILATLSDLEEQNGNELEAKNLKCRAQEIVGFIAENAGSKALRNSFLAQPEVRQIMSET